MEDNKSVIGILLSAAGAIYMTGFMITFGYILFNSRMACIEDSGLLGFFWCDMTDAQRSPHAWLESMLWPLFWFG